MEFPGNAEPLELRAACRLVLAKLEEAGMLDDAITLAFAVGWCMRVLTDALAASEPAASTDAGEVP